MLLAQYCNVPGKIGFKDNHLVPGIDQSLVKVTCSLLAVLCYGGHDRKDWQQFTRQRLCNYFIRSLLSTCHSMDSHFLYSRWALSNYGCEISRARDGMLADKKQQHVLTYHNGSVQRFSRRGRYTHFTGCVVANVIAAVIVGRERFSQQRDALGGKQGKLSQVQ